MPTKDIKKEPLNIQQQDSYEQQILEHQNAQNQPNDYEEQAILDEDDEFQIYEESPVSGNQNPQKASSDNPFHQQNQDKESSSIDFGTSELKDIKKEPEQPDTDLEQETEKISHLLKTKYSHFQQDILIQMLYDKCFPKNIKVEPIEGINERNDFESNKKMARTVKIFVEHGYGLNIARQHAQKSEIIQPNPYNNSIYKIVKETWKGIENQIYKIRKSMKPLSTEKFNNIKTFLINARRQLNHPYLDIFLAIVSYTNGMTSTKPSSNDFEKLYDFLIQAKGRKHFRNKSLHKNKKSKEKISRYEESSEEFKVPKHQEKKIVYGKPPRAYAKKEYDE